MEAALDEEGDDFGGGGEVDSLFGKEGEFGGERGAGLILSTLTHPPRRPLSSENTTTPPESTVAPEAFFTSVCQNVTPAALPTGTDCVGSVSATRVTAPPSGHHSTVSSEAFSPSVGAKVTSIALPLYESPEICTAVGTGTCSAAISAACAAMVAAWSSISVLIAAN